MVCIRGRLGDFSRLLAQAEAPGAGPWPLPAGSDARPQCPALQVAVLASATGTAASPGDSAGRLAGPLQAPRASSWTRPRVAIKKGRARAGGHLPTDRRRPYGPLASTGQGTRSSAGPQPLPTSGYLTSRPNTLGSQPAWQCGSPSSVRTLYQPCTCRQGGCQTAHWWDHIQHLTRAR